MLLDQMQQEHVGLMVLMHLGLLVNVFQEILHPSTVDQVPLQNILKLMAHVLMVLVPGSVTIMVALSSPSYHQADKGIVNQINTIDSMRVQAVPFFLSAFLLLPFLSSENEIDFCHISFPWYVHCYCTSSGGQYS